MVVVLFAVKTPPMYYYALHIGVSGVHIRTDLRLCACRIARSVFRWWQCDTVLGALRASGRTLVYREFLLHLPVTK